MTAPVTHTSPPASPHGQAAGPRQHPPTAAGGAGGAWTEYGVLLVDGRVCPAATLHDAFRWGESPGGIVVKRRIVWTPVRKSGRALYDIGGWQLLDRPAERAS